MGLNGKSSRWSKRKEAKKPVDIAIMGRKQSSLFKILAAQIILFPLGAGYYLAGQGLRHAFFILLFWAPLLTSVVYPHVLGLLVWFYAMLFVGSMIDLWYNIGSSNREVEVDFMVDKHGGEVSGSSSLRELNK